jgi:hypothetical protein
MVKLVFHHAATRPWCDPAGARHPAHQEQQDREFAVRAVVHGQPVKNLEALANPEALEHFKNRAELRT